MANAQGMADASGVSSGNPRANLAWQQADFPAAFLCHAAPTLMGTARHGATGCPTPGVR